MRTFLPKAGNLGWLCLSFVLGCTAPSSNKESSLLNGNVFTQEMPQRILPAHLAKSPLADIVNDDGEPLLSEDDLSGLVGKKVEAEFVQRLYGTVSQGRRLFPTGSHITSAINRGIDIEMASNLEAILDERGNPIMTDGLILHSYTKSGGTPAYARALYSLTIEGHRLFPDKWDIEMAQSRRLTLDQAGSLDLIRADDGTPIITNGNLIHSLNNDRVPLSYIRALAAIRTSSGERAFTQSDIVRFAFNFDFQSKKGRVPVDFAASLAGIAVPEGGRSFDGGMVNMFYNKSGTLAYAQELAAMRMFDGTPLFDALSIVLLHRGRQIVPFNPTDFPFSEEGFKKLRQLLNAKPPETLPFARSLYAVKDTDGNPRYDGQAMFALYQLGLTKDDIPPPDTPKPNAAIVLGLPENDIYGAFARDEFLDIVRVLMREYDVDITVAGNEIDAYKATRRLPNTELYIIAGHGGPKVITLWSEGIRQREGRKEEMHNPEQFEIDTGDDEIGGHLAHLHPEATILLFSCLTGYGGRQGDNLYNFIVEKAGGRRVIAATDSFVGKDVEISRAYPLDMQIYDHGRHEDLMVVSQ